MNKFDKMQSFVITFYKPIIKLAFNIAIFILIFSLGIGIWKTVDALSAIFTESPVRTSLKELVTSVLSLIVIWELIRTFVDYFEYERVRIEILLELLLAFVIREFMIHLFEAKIFGIDFLWWCAGVLLIILGRTVSILYNPEK